MNIKCYRLGVIGSSGGSALAAASDCLVSAGFHINWTVVTDRQCGLEVWAKDAGHDVHRITYSNADDFSLKAYSIFDAAGCDNILLFYTRRVTSPLIDRKQVSNIHPSLLPAFRGLHGIKDALSYGVRIIGATLHRVDEGLDTGKIIAQVCAPLPANITESSANYLSYLQKVWLCLAWFDRATTDRNSPNFDSCGPGVMLACPGISCNIIRTSYENWLSQRKNEIDQRLK